MRRALVAAGALAGAGAAMTIAAFAAAGSDPAPSTRATRAGLDVWLEQGCGSCHTFEPAGSTGPIGPDLQKTLHGKSHDYVMESIVLPGKRAAAGYPAGMMPGDYAQRIGSQDLEALAEFLMDGARN
jgi:mono/diheme cytochrome c family protein